MSKKSSRRSPSSRNERRAAIRAKTQAPILPIQGLKPATKEDLEASAPPPYPPLPDEDFGPV